MPTTLTLRVPPHFSLAHAVCSYGYFLLPPNRWDRETRWLHRPLRRGVYGEGDVVDVTVGQDPREPRTLRLRVSEAIPRVEHAPIRMRVARMLRLDEDFRAWHRRHPAAKRDRFDRMFRSPTFFEDIIKTITGQNVTWRNTIMMNRLLVDRVGGGGFPTPEQLASLDPPTRLNDLARVGYRAERIVRLARRVVDGSLDLAWFESPHRTSDEVYDTLLKLHGIGPYAAANLCMLLGYYDRVAIDTETYRHHCQARGIARPDDPKKLHAEILAEYQPYHPYHFLAYWYSLWRDYQKRFGPATRWDAATDGPNFSAANMKPRVMQRVQTATDAHR